MRPKYTQRVGAGLLSALSLVLATHVHAVKLDPTFHSPVITSAVDPKRVLVLPNDSFLVFSNFDRLNGLNYGALIKFNSDGTPDLTFRMRGENFSVHAVSLASGGKLIVAALQLDKRQVSERVLRLNADGSIDPSFQAGVIADDTIYSLALQTDGKILVGGIFKRFNGQDRPYLVRLNVDGSLDTSFAVLSLVPTNNPNFVEGVRANIIIDSGDKIIIGGSFSVVNGAARSGVARLNRSGTLDASFAPAFTNFPPGGSSVVPIRGLALDSDGTLLVGGRFVSSGSSDVTPLLRLDPNGGVVKYFPGRTTSPLPVILALKLLANREVIGVGDRLYKFSGAGATISGFQNNTYGNQAQSVDTLSTGQILVAGIGTLNHGFIRYSASGAAELYDAGEFQREQIVQQLGLRSDGQICIANEYAIRVDGSTRNGVARLNSNGTLTGLNPASYATGFALDSSDRIVLFYGYEPRYYDFPTTYSRLDANDTADGSFQADPNDIWFTDMVTTPQGSYLVSRVLSAQAVLEDNVVQRLQTNGARDAGFHFGVDFQAEATRNNQQLLFVGDARALAFYPDGRFLARYFDANSDYRLKRFNADGSTDQTFQPGTVPARTTISGYETFPLNLNGGLSYRALVTRAPGTPLNDALVLPDGKLIVVGMFDYYNGMAAPGIVRLDSDGVIDAAFTPGAGAQWLSTPVDPTNIPRIDAVKRLADGRLLITGNFEAYDGHPLPGIARLMPNGNRDITFFPPIAMQSLWSSYADQFLTFPVSQLALESGGNILVTGNFAAAGSDSIRSLVRLTGLTDALIDTDGDGIPDDFEAEYFGSTTAGDPFADADRDGMNNLQEFLAGTDPLDGASALRITALRRQVNDIVIGFQAIAGRSYRVSASASLGNGFPVVVANVPASLSDKTMEITDAGAALQSWRYYRVELVP